MSGSLIIIPVTGIGEIGPGDDLADMIAEATRRTEESLLDGDVLVVTQKVVSKAEDRLVDVDPTVGHKPLVERESVRILRARGGCRCRTGSGTSGRPRGGCSPSW